MWRYLAILSAIIAYSTGAVLDMSDVNGGTICNNKPDGDVVRHPLDCHSYFICGKVPTIQYCDEGLHFDAVRKVCNWPEQAKCDLRSLDKNDQQQSADTITLRSHPLFIAIDIETGRLIDPMDKYDPKAIECRHYGAYFLPHPSSCRRYFICAYGHLHKHMCGYGTAWNYKRQECELDSESECYSRSITGIDIDAGNVYIPDENNEAFDALISSYETSTTTTAATSIMASTVCFVIDTTIEGTGTTGSTWYPTGSYHTATGTGSTESTWHPTGTYHTATATATSTETTVVPLSSAERIDGLSPNQKCPKSGEAYLPHIEDCSKYFICILGRPVPTTCPQGLYWDQNAEFCDLAKNVKCYQKQ